MLGWLSATNAAVPNKNFAKEALLSEIAGVAPNPENVIEKTSKTFKILICIDCPFLPLWALMDYSCTSCLKLSNNG